MDPGEKPLRITPHRKANRNNSKSESTIAYSVDKISRTTLSQTFEVNLCRFCPRKLFYIFFINPTNDASSTLLSNIAEINKEFREISSLTFISRENVLGLLDPEISNSIVLPKYLKQLLLILTESIDIDNQVSVEVEIQLIKLKLLEVMYQQYIDRVKKNERKTQLETVLNSLTKECKKKHKKDATTRQNTTKEDNIVKKNKKEDKGVVKEALSKDEDLDYTTISIENDEINFEENIFDHVYFYCFTGFFNGNLFPFLIQQVDVPVCGIVKIQNSEPLQDNEQTNEFWKNIEELFFYNTSNCKSLENTILLNFTSSNPDNALTSLEELIFMLRKILSLKLTHLAYLKHLNVHEIKHSYAKMHVECFQQYNRSLRNYPLECINCEVILESILKEICYMKNDTYSKSSTVLHQNSFYKSVHCVDALYDQEVLYKIKDFSMKRNQKPFLTHEKDFLLKTLKSYKGIGPKVVDVTLAFMKRMPFLKELNQVFETREFYHLHDVDPQKEQQLENESLTNFMYLFLFNKIFSEKEEKQLESSIFCENSRNLCTFNLKEYINDMQTKFNSNEDCVIEENLYDTSVVHFRWKEILSKNVLLQEIFRAFNDFTYVDIKYSPETDNFLTLFSDKLNDFGLNTKIYNDTIRTPICFRDFCRYVVQDEVEWVEKNQRNINEKTFCVKFDSNCPGVQRAKINLFQEYWYLLSENIKDDYDNNETCEDPPKITEFQGMNFLQVLNDLETCSSIDFNPIMQDENVAKDMKKLAFNLGSNLFKTTGKLTTFCSHDNVKITVDNSRFLQNPSKCTFNVINNGNRLILHSEESLLARPFITTLCLKNNTRVSFILRIDNVKQEEVVDQFSDEQAIENINHNEIPETIMEETIDEMSSTKVVENITVDVHPLVHCVDEDFVKNLLKIQSLEDLSVNDNYDDLLKSLQFAIESNATIYKVNPKMRYLKSKHTHMKIPLRNALRNIVPIEAIQPKPLPYDIFTKCFKTQSTPKLSPDYPIDIRVCLPNGLYIRPYTCLVNKKALMIKQEYIQEKPQDSEVQHEEFRLFSNQGLVLIKKIDGTVIILTANGDIITLEKPTEGSVKLNDNTQLSPCHCSTLEQYRNKLNKMLKNLENTNCSISRRGHLKSKQNYILDAKILKVLQEFDVPFLKKSILKFDGKKIKIFDKKITQKQLHHMISQQNFFTGDLNYERSDNFKSVLYKTGGQKVIFPDGTVISNSIDMTDELVENFVFVRIRYKYEHPYYSTVKFNYDNSSVICLNNEVIIEETPERDGFCVKMEDTFSVTCTSDNIIACKTCENCPGRFEANFTVTNFKNGLWTPSEIFMRSKDTYGKEFCSDFIGNCTRNSNFSTGSANAFKCNNHYAKSQYKKLFVVNKDLSGMSFVSNDRVKYKIEDTEAKSHGFVKIYNTMSGDDVTIIDCRQKIYQPFSNRFYNNKIVPFSSEFYIDFRIFRKMFESIDEIEEYVSKLWELFFQEQLDRFGDAIYKNLAALGNAVEAYHRKYHLELLEEERKLQEKKRKQLKERRSSSKRILTIQEKLMRWKNERDELKRKIKDMEIPKYFNT
ncbi:hypothetical protein ABEB36_009856 [Hypothenemus hampei]|uniref:Uncharacterized protein n=1 Tax=Hypothenemus hampei TaxID=57062 RepID=A0ABD1EKP2_HYPHA